MTRAKLILMGDGKAIYVPPRLLTPTTAEMIRDAFQEWKGDPANIALIMGEPVEVVDNRPREPRTVAEVVLREAPREEQRRLTELGHHPKWKDCESGHPGRSHEQWLDDEAPR